MDRSFRKAINQEIASPIKLLENEQGVTKIAKAEMKTSFQLKLKTELFLTISPPMALSSSTATQSTRSGLSLYKDICSVFEDP